MIDVFAVLVFFLLVNALVVQVIPTPPALQLPAAAIAPEPRPGIAITVGTEEVRLGERVVQSTAQLLRGDSKALRAALAQLPMANDKDRGEINILADKRVSYRALREVMNACSDSRYAQVSLAVADKPGGGA
ncbi:biopolymer transporter ExbD [Solimonas sp. K1W22B-7]|nr:biopolymer transporter ExbD [Solimonas sp. K1W22B-7]